MATLKDIAYEIVSFTKATATLLVKYKTSVFSEGLTYPIDLPIVDGAVPTGAALDELIMSLAPVGQLTDAEIHKSWLDARTTALTGVDLSPIEALVPAQPVEVQPVSTGAQTL